MSCQSRVNPNEWIVSTATCWNTMSVLKTGQIVPRLITTCDRIVILPATELAADFKIEKKLQELAKEGFVDRGVEFNNLPVNVNLSPQAEEALDVISALNFYKENGQEELGRKIIEAKAGATKIIINRDLKTQNNE